MLFKNFKFQYYLVGVKQRRVNPITSFHKAANNIVKNRSTQRLKIQNSKLKIIYGLPKNKGFMKSTRIDILLNSTRLLSQSECEV